MARISNDAAKAGDAEATNNLNANGTIGSWTQITSRLLSEGGPSAWNVLDGILGEEAARGMEQELKVAGLIEKLRPARTKGEAKADELLSILMQQQDQHPTKVAPLPASTSSRRIRGDKSIFLSREYRARMDFPERYPLLHRLIEAIQSTAIRELSHAMDFDVGQTSVQLAVYPGDGSSGYSRHCDRGSESCRAEAETTKRNPKEVDEHQSKPSPVGRLVTAVYYLTHEDWSAPLDGGALRVFHSSSSSPNVYTDIPPYRDRLLLFRSDGVEHEVLPSLRRSRMALTVWLSGTLRRHNLEPSTAASIPSASLGLASLPESPSDNNDHTFIKQSSGPPPLPLSIPKWNAESLDKQEIEQGRHTSPQSNHTCVPSVFVAISSYRDSETVPTIRSLFGQAHDTSRIVVGLMLQLDEDDPTDRALAIDLQALRSQYPNQIRCLRLAAQDALGPCYARFLCQSLHRGEAYYLQVDSHMRFRKNWDAYLIGLHRSIVTQRHSYCKDSKETKNNPSTIGSSRLHPDRVILTTYPVGYTLPNNIPDETRGTLLVPWKFDDSGLLRQKGCFLRASPIPVLCHLMAGGFFFGPASVLQDVPYDPSLHHLFFGEELNMAIRLFTHGYDCYAPPEMVCYHLWSRSHRPTQQPISNVELAERKRSIHVVKQQLMGNDTTVQDDGCDKLEQQPAVFSPRPRKYFPMGTVRSSTDFALALGVDFAKAAIVLPSNDSHVANEELHPHPEAALEQRVAALDRKAQDLIAFFLSGIT